MPHPIHTLPADARAALAARQPQLIPLMGPTYRRAGVPCRYEGPVVTWCATCTGEAAEARHVRQCLHPDVDWDLCTRGPVGPDVKACSACFDFQIPGVLLCGGYGDFYAIEAMMSPEAKRATGAVHIACPAADDIATLIRHVRGWEGVDTYVLPTNGRTYHTKWAVEQAFGPLPGVEDWSIASTFPKNLPYVGSGLLSSPLGPVPDFVPDPPYVAIVPHSGWGRWHDRDFSPADWAACLATLDRLSLTGVMLSKETAPVAPDHPRLVDLRGQTTILETIEILKHAVGYAGIDSGLSVLAAKLFPADRLAVKSVKDHCYQWKHVYFAPWTTYQFLDTKLNTTHWR